MLMAIPTFMSAQKIVSDEFDEFENSHCIKTDIAKLSKESLKNWTGQTMFYFEAKGKLIYLHILWQCRDVLFIPQGTEAFLLFDDGSKFTLKSAHDVKPIPSIASTALVKPSGVLGVDIPYYSLDILNLSGKLIKKLRIITSEGYKDFDIIQKNQSLISKYLDFTVEHMKF